MAEGDTLVNGLLGGIVAIVLSAIPFSPVLGGGVAGYLEGGSRRDGLWVGALAGVVAAIPIAAVVVAVLLVSGAALVGIGPRAAGGLALFVLFFLFVLVLSALYTIGLGALGGWLGNYVKYDTDLLD